MRNPALIGLPIALFGASCTSSLRVGPEWRSLPDGSVMGGRGTLAAGLGGASGGAVQLTVPVSFSAGAGLDSEAREGCFETGLEWTRTHGVLGYRLSPRVGVELGETSGSTLGLRGGPLLYFSDPEDGESVVGLTLEGLVAGGVGGDVEGHGVYGVSLSIGMDSFSPPLRIPSGRPLRDAEGSEWRGSARFGRCTEIRLARGLPREEREHRGLGYVAQGLEEYASIVSFERLAVELGRAGAPRPLVADARAAARDEARHAAQCFALASAHLGREIRPPSLPPNEPRRGATPGELARESWFDGFLGEGRAASLLLDRSRRAPELRVRRTLASIARDEARHATLGLRIFLWGTHAERAGRKQPRRISAGA